MSKASYGRNVAAGVAGPENAVCFVAALEQTTTYSYSPAVYKRYERFADWWDTLSPAEHYRHKDDYEEVLDMLAQPLGGLSCKDMIFKDPPTAIGWARVIKKLLKEGFQVTADIDYAGDGWSVHTVGIIPVDQDCKTVNLVSTHVPSYLQGNIPLEKVAKHRFVIETEELEEYFPPCPFMESTILALPRV